jgi:ribosome-associated translation inhibitor RaiA
MKTHISTKGTDLTDELRGRTEVLAAELGKLEPGASMAKFMLEEQGERKSVSVVAVVGDGDTVVRHALADDWDQAFVELRRKLERALEES